MPRWLTEPLWNQFTVLLPERPCYHPNHPLGWHRRRISDRIVFDKLLQVLRFGCSYEAITDSTCSASTIRNRRDEWVHLGIFSKLKRIALDTYDRIVGLEPDRIAIDGAITKAPRGGEAAGRSPVDRGKQGLKRSGMTDGYGIPLGRVLAGANHHDSPRLAPTLDRLYELGPLPTGITVHLDAGYDSDITRALLDARGLQGQIAHKGEKAPVQATGRWQVERTHAWQNAFRHLARCYERRTTVIDAFFDLTDTIITIRSLIRRAWTTHRWDDRPTRCP
ncbi:IS5 family transposase [Streptomyces sp. NRRL B-3648]|uniref:IS5 family transposase n=1 Tax=Streptomyces sp. NRRL B-3648 TaxID=1519493 RepID=UPI0006ADD071|nr:IS5 family transposase [Streptomyces sp. NRRL B-3648]KOX11482.1 transposase [Streptomyces sp. NRRL B-3648]